MRRTLLLLGFCLLLALPARAALNRWSSAGPAAGGPIVALAFDPSAPGTVYAGTYGGVFRSEDHGATWTSASFGLAAFQVSHLEVDPLHPGTVYAITQRGFQKSQDGGRNWQVPVDLRVTAFAMSRPSPQNLLAADGDQIYLSFDAGASWDPGPVLPGEEQVTILEIDPQAPANVYAGTHQGLFRSTDGGASFAPLTRPGTGFLDGLAIDPANPQILYAATFDGVFKSTDRGLTWARAGQELAGKFIFEVAVDPTAPANLLAVGTQVYRSTDGGASWTPVFDRVLSNHTAAFDPSSPSTWLLGTQEGVYRSTNQGASWLSSNTGLFASLVRKLAVDPHRPGVLYAALHGAGTLHKSADAGASWSRLSLSAVRALARPEDAVPPLRRHGPGDPPQPGWREHLGPDQLRRDHGQRDRRRSEDPLDPVSGELRRGAQERRRRHLLERDRAATGGFLAVSAGDRPERATDRVCR